MNSIKSHIENSQSSKTTYVKNDAINILNQIMSDEKFAIKLMEEEQNAYKKYLEKTKADEKYAKNLSKKYYNMISFDEEIAKSLQFMEDNKKITPKITTLSSDLSPTLSPTVISQTPTLSTTPSVTKSLFKPSDFSNEGDKYTLEERKIWEEKLKDSVLDKINIPEGWVPSPIIEGTGVDNSSSYSLIKLDKDGECYKKLLKNYKNTSGNHSSNNVDIYKVQNYEKFYEFIRNREKMIKKIGEENLNETTLYHGTKQSFDICSTGLDMRYGRGGLYGNGIYFADLSEISIGFSGSLITVNKVLLGKKYNATRNKKHFIHPPKGYNSVFAQRGNKGHEYILYNNNYSYIEYVIYDKNIIPKINPRNLSILRNRSNLRNRNNFNSFIQTNTQNRKYNFISSRKFIQVRPINGNWFFKKLNGNIILEVGTKKYLRRVTCETQDISSIIRYCKKYEKDSKNKNKIEKLTFENGLKIIKKRKDMTKISKYNSLNKEKLIKEINKRINKSGDLYNRPWLYYGRTYKKFQLVGILMMDDDIENKYVKKITSAFKSIQKKWRSRKK